MDKAEKNYNLGIEILRLLLCFLVVVCHFWSSGDGDLRGWKSALAWIRGYAVPAFMVMSFYFCEPKLEEKNWKAIWRRIGKLYIPLAGWAVIYFVIYRVIRVDGIRWSDLLWQASLGHSTLNQTMWFQVDLILLTLLFALLINIFYNYKQVLLAAALVAWTLQYSGINRAFGILPGEMSFPLGRLCEMLPFAVGGAVLYWIGMDRIRKHRFFACAVSVVTIGFLYLADVFAPVAGFGYAGIQCLIVGMALVVFFYCLPLENIRHGRRAFHFVSSCSMGVYCVHRLVARIFAIILGKVAPSLQLQPLIFCVIVYCISLGISCAGAWVFRGTRLKNLFQ